MSRDTNMEELSFQEQQAITGILETYRSNPSNSNKYRFELFAHIEALIAAKTTEAKDEVLDELLDWYNNPPINTKPFNWYGAVHALKVSKDFKKPFTRLSQLQTKMYTQSDQDEANNFKRGTNL